MKVMPYAEIPPQPYSGCDAQGVIGRVAIGRADGAENFCMRVFELAPGGHTADHTHDFEHEVFVHAGQGVILKDGEPLGIGPGSIIFIPGQERHQLRNTGRETLVFACVIPAGWPEL